MSGEPAHVALLAGGTTLVTNAGSNGKFLGVMDFDVKGGKVADFRYRLLPVFANQLKADPAAAPRLVKELDEMADKAHEERIEQMTPVGATCAPGRQTAGNLDRLHREVRKIGHDQVELALHRGQHVALYEERRASGQGCVHFGELERPRT